MKNVFFAIALLFASSTMLEASTNSEATAAQQAAVNKESDANYAWSSAAMAHQSCKNCSVMWYGTEAVYLISQEFHEYQDDMLVAQEFKLLGSVQSNEGDEDFQSAQTYEMMGDQVKAAEYYDKAIVHYNYSVSLSTVAEQSADEALDWCHIWMHEWSPSGP